MCWINDSCQIFFEKFKSLSPSLSFHLLHTQSAGPLKAVGKPIVRVLTYHTMLETFVDTAWHKFESSHFDHYRKEPQFGHYLLNYFWSFSWHKPKEYLYEICTHREEHKDQKQILELRVHYRHLPLYSSVRVEHFAVFAITSKILRFPKDYGNLFHSLESRLSFDITCSI